MEKRFNVQNEELRHCEENAQHSTWQPIWRVRRQEGKRIGWLRHCGLDPQSQNCDDYAIPDPHFVPVRDDVRAFPRPLIERGKISRHPELVSGSINVYDFTPHPNPLPQRGEGSVTSLPSYLPTLLPSKCAFTLAEVLITLAIVGVVAVLTLPPLIQHHKEKSTITKVKKVYSVLSQAFQLSVSETGLYPKDWGMGDMYDANSHIAMANGLIPYMKLSENCVGKGSNYTKEHCYEHNYDQNKYAVVVLADGTVLIFRTISGDCSLNWGKTNSLKNICGAIYADINGDKKPNLSGHDRFTFNFSNYGIIPAGTIDDTNRIFKTLCTKNKVWGQNYDGYGNGTACTAWVILNENMDYLHCDGLDWNGKKKCK